ncbi:MAG TPA: dihydrolipoamide acetyltransferase family protein, partial [Trebonia sp.]|nr:dihydrolipoamide acetyltransferase family protein [Trebonia sp.]
EIETDKAVMEYEAYQSGTLAKILVPEGQTVDIGTPIALIDDGTGGGAEESPATAEPAAPVAVAASAATAAPATAAPATAPVATAPAATAQVTAPPAPAPATNGNGNGNGARQFASPLVRKIARENHLDLSAVTGTGPGGRIIRADIDGLLAGAKPAPAAAVSAAPAGVTTDVMAGNAPAAAPAADDLRGSRSVPVSNVRRVIARRLGASAREIPHYYVTAVADAQALMDLRATLNGQLTEAGRPKVSVNDLLIRAVALALRAHPEVNVSYGGDDSPTMLVHDRVNIGVAVAAESGLIVPVIRDADTKTVTQIGLESKELVALAGERKLTPAQLSGGTFTISNLGMFGVEDFTAIINAPESAILAVGATVREPAVVGNEIVPRYRLRYTLSSDHRVIDGALAARFLATLTKLVESPWMIIA